MLIDKPEDMAVVLRRQGPPRALELVATVMAGLELRPDAACLLLKEPELWESAAQALGPQGSPLVPVPRSGTQLLVVGRAWIPAGHPGGPVPVRLRVIAADEGPAGAPVAPRPPSAPAPRLSKTLQVRGEARADAATAVNLPELGPVQSGPPEGKRAREQARAQAAAWLSAWPHAHGTPAPAAPADQCMPVELRGDEILDMLHLHPRQRELRMRLPGLRPRCSWVLPGGAAPAGAPRVTDLPLRACTLWLFPDAMRGILVFEARVPAAVAYAVQGESLQARWEPCAGAAPAGAAAGPPAPSARQAAPAAEPGAFGFSGGPVERGAPPPASPDPAVQARALHAEMAEGARRLLREQGWSQARLDELDALGCMPDAQQPAGCLEELLRQLQEQTDALRRSHGIDDATLQRFASLAERELQDGGGDAAAPQLLAQALKALEAASQRALADAGLDQQQALALLRRHQPEAAEALQAARALDPAPPDPGPAPQAAAAASRGEPGSPALTRELVRQYLSEKRSLRGAGLDGLDLRGLDFSDADLREAQARGTRLEACSLRRADLREALLHDTDLRGADLRDARLGACSLARARLDGALLDGADCSGADFTRAALSQAGLRGASLRRCVFEQADLRGVLAEGCQAEEAQFGACRLDDGDWRGSSLCATAWLDCSLDRLRADAADARELALHGSRGREAVFERADLRGSRAGETTRLIAARLREADLRGACWEGSVLAAADLGACRLDGADFSRVRARGARMPGVHASSLRLDEADLRGADLRGAKLFQAGLSGADLRGACLSGALCFGAELADTRALASTWQGADVRRTVLAARAAAACGPGAPAEEPAS